MDDSWGNIIYLIAAALFGIVSMLRKKKRPNTLSPPVDDDDEILQQPKAKSSGDMESIFEALLGTPSADSYTQPIESAEYDVEVEPEREETMMEEYHRKEKLKAEAREEKTKSTLTNLDAIRKEGEEQSESIDEEEEKIDWRQAIIYKEILDRKYN